MLLQSLAYNMGSSNIVFGKHSYEYKGNNKNLTDKYKILSIESNIRKRELQEQEEMTKLKTGQTTTQFNSDTLFSLIITHQPLDNIDGSQHQKT